MDFARTIADELQLSRGSVERTLALLEGGATVPFLSRYRKEATGNLDETQIASIRDRHGQLVELEARRKTVLETIDGQGHLTAELRAKIEAARTRTELEDLYLPFRPKRRTRATKAREAGYEPLADLLWGEPDRLDRSLHAIAAEYGDPKEALQGARDIVAERIADHPDVRRELREHALREGRLASKKARARKGKALPDFRKFEGYFDHSEPVRTIPSHRVLAVGRGENEGALRVSVELEDERRAFDAVRRRIIREPRGPAASQLEQAAQDAFQRLLMPSIEGDVRRHLTERAEVEAIRVFSENLRHLLMAPPLGQERVLAIDPGFRSGCKLVALDETGRLLEDAVIYPHEPQRREADARRMLASMCKRHRATAIAVGNGTAGRETFAFIKRMREEGELAKGAKVVSVNESGASIYSASELAREEFPGKDVTVRGAVSIGRRLQDPLAELVKLDPKTIGVGQYQHDVNQTALQRALEEVVESCVNQVGVEVNTASAQLLAYVAGIGPTIARNIVSKREEEGSFHSRAQLKRVPRLGPRAFEQAAGFLRIRGARHPLDASAVHPERYSLVERMAKDQGLRVADLLGNAELVRRLDPNRYVSDDVGEPTLRDILTELEKPGRDPRAAFEEASFRDDVNEMEDLREGMVLEGVVTNVTSFGAFVDVGVHQDGLVHVSQLANRFVRDPAEVVKVGDRVRTRVLSIDLERRRIGLSMKDTAPHGT